MTYPCAYCGSPASSEDGCPSCGRGPDPDALEVVRVDAEIAELNGRLAVARQAVRGIEEGLVRLWNRRQATVARVQANVTAEEPAPPPVREVSNRLVQNALFLLGGLLLGVAAIVFTAVAWAQFGVGGRAVVLASFTVATLAVPFFALRRGLTATAETFAAVGLLLLLLDGYAAWYVNLFGVADGSAWGYAGAVGAVTAVVAAGYERVTGLAGPRFAALLAAQPVIPLLAVTLEPGPAGWALTIAAVAAFDVAVLALRRGTIGSLAAVTGSLAVLVAAGLAVAGMFFPVDFAAAATASGSLVVTAVVALAGAIAWRQRTLREIVSGLLLVAVAVAAGRITGLGVAWWTVPIVDLVVVAGALAWALRVRGVALVAPVTAVAFLGLHAVATGLDRAGVAATVFAAVAVLGAATALLGRGGPLVPPATLAGLLAVPAAVAAAGVEWSGSATLRTGAVLVAAAAIAAMVWLRRLGTTAEIAAHTGAVIALGLIDGSAERAAAVFALWGLVLGMRARRRGYLVAAAVAELVAGILVLADHGVTTLEAYTLPTAAVALLAGLLLRRGDSSWVAYGPALAAAFLPSLAAILADGDEQHLRRLLLGVAAVAVVVAGAATRLRAPVLMGGGALTVLALYELAQFWDLIPRWIPLAAAGLVLVMVATTFERRRRDLDRFRAVIHRMS